MRSAAIGFALSLLCSPTGSAGAETARLPLAEQGRRMAAEWVQADSPRSRPTPQQSRMSKRKAAVLGALVGAGGGAVVGALHCQADCGGGPTRGALVFAPFGAGIGAAAGVLMTWLVN